MKFYNYKPIRLIELFAGIGSQAKALKNLGVDFEHWFVCEFDEPAIRSYNAVHGTDFTTSDVTKITANDLNICDAEHFTYLLTYSFPCQDLSNAGKGQGMEKGSGTRSGLLWEVERLLNESDELPQVLLMENVPQVHSAKNREHFDKWIAFLESKGYSNHWQDLNSKDYGIPQSRNRCYMVSILGDYSFEFPEPVPLELRLGDLMEREPDEKYYLSEDRCDKIANWKSQQNPLERVSGVNSISPTLTARGAGEYHSGMILFSPGLEDTTNLRSVVLQRAVCNNAVDIIKPRAINARLRVITPVESWRLMGFDDIDLDRASKVCDPKHLYQQAGNSIVVNVLMAIFKELFIPTKTRSEWLDKLLGGDS